LFSAVVAVNSMLKVLQKQFQSLNVVVTFVRRYLGDKKDITLHKWKCNFSLSMV